MAAFLTYGYSNLNPRIIDASPSFKEVYATIQIGNGTDTYTTGGLALDGSKLGLPNAIDAVIFLDQIVTGGYFATFVPSSKKIMLYTNAGVEIANSITPNAAVNIIARGY